MLDQVKQRNIVAITSQSDQESSSAGVDLTSSDVSKESASMEEIAEQQPQTQQHLSSLNSAIVISSDSNNKININDNESSANGNRAEYETRPRSRTESSSKRQKLNNGNDGSARTSCSSSPVPTQSEDEEDEDEEEDLVLGDTLVNRLRSISEDDETEWVSTSLAIVTRLEKWRSQWNELEKEKRKLVRSSAAMNTRRMG